MRPQPGTQIGASQRLRVLVAACSSSAFSTKKLGMWCWWCRMLAPLQGHQMTMAHEVDTSATVARILAIRKGSSDTAPASISNPSPKPQGDSQSAFDRQRGEQNIRHLCAMCVLAPELERLTQTARRHWNRGAYQRKAIIDPIHRNVVEPSAIALSAAQVGQTLPWFKTYPLDMRERLATRLALIVEQDVGIDVTNSSEGSIQTAAAHLAPPDGME